jgi:hypothetical protein
MLAGSYEAMVPEEERMKDAEYRDLVLWSKYLVGLEPEDRAALIAGLRPAVMAGLDERESS